MFFSGKGDDGFSQLSRSNRISKDDSTFEALGTLDELSSFLGLCRQNSNADIPGHLKGMQEHLFVIQAHLAGSKKKVTKQHVRFLEAIIYKFEKKLPAPTGFIIPGATPSSAYLDVARTIARRAERRMATLAKEKSLAPDTIPYLNRLSSALYVIARFVAKLEGVVEEHPQYPP